MGRPRMLCSQQFLLIRFQTLIANSAAEIIKKKIQALFHVLIRQVIYINKLQNLNSCIMIMFTYFNWL